MPFIFQTCLFTQNSARNIPEDVYSRISLKLNSYMLRTAAERRDTPDNVLHLDLGNMLPPLADINY